jgi:hypothetical protein
MTESRNPDRLIRAWLDLMPNEAPDRVVSDVLQAAETTPQLRVLPRFGDWRFPMNRMALIGGAAILAVLIGGGFVLSNFRSPSVGNPTVAPTFTPAPVVTPGPTGGPIPAELQGRWMGGHRDFADPDAGTSLLLEASSYSMQQSNDNTGATVRGDASSEGFNLHVTAAVGDGCDRLAEGVYAWSLSASGRVLTMTPDHDACAARTRNIPGTYWLMACRDPGTDCLGDLDPGTYQSQFIRPLLPDGAVWAPMFGGVTYTVPDGWANFSDWPGVLGLTTSTDFANTTPSNVQPLTQLTVFTHAMPLAATKACSFEPVSAIPSSLDAALADLDKVKGLTVGATSSLSIGGHQAAFADLTFDAAGAAACGDEISFMKGGGDTLSIGAGERQRLYLVEVGEAGFVALWLRTPDAASFDQVVAPAAAIAESMSFN